MEAFFGLISVVLFALAISSFVLIVRESSPFLVSDDQRALRDYWKPTGGFTAWSERDRAVRHAWSEHTRRFPKSRKRLFFAVLLIVAAGSVMFYPLWLAVSQR
jgi:hypothetical protein